MSQATAFEDQYLDIDRAVKTFRRYQIAHGFVAGAQPQMPPQPQQQLQQRCLHQNNFSVGNCHNYQRGNNTAELCQRGYQRAFQRAVPAVPVAQAQNYYSETRYQLQMQLQLQQKQQQEAENMLNRQYFGNGVYSQTPGGHFTANGTPAPALQTNETFLANQMGQMAPQMPQLLKTSSGGSFSSNSSSSAVFSSDANSLRSSSPLSLELLREIDPISSNNSSISSSSSGADRTSFFTKNGNPGLQLFANDASCPGSMLQHTSSGGFSGLLADGKLQAPSPSSFQTDGSIGLFLNRNIWGTNATTNTNTSVWG